MLKDYIDAAIFDMDGVVTDTADIHAHAWKAMFDEVLRDIDGACAKPFDIVVDYQTYVDGKRREDGIRAFLNSRNIHLPEGDSGDPPGRRTVAALARRKNTLFHELLKHDGVRVFKSTVKLIRQLRADGIRTAVVSSSRNCQPILQRAGLEALFDARIDGILQKALELKGKPAPDIFIAAAAELNLKPARAMVIEDALAGVEAGRAGHFALIVGVARHDNGPALIAHGADVVVKDLDELTLDGINAWFDKRNLSHAVRSGTTEQPAEDTSRWHSRRFS